MDRDRKTATRKARPFHDLAVLSAVVLAAGLSLAACGPPDLALEHIQRGDAALAKKRYAEATSAYAHAHEIAPHDPRVQTAQMRARVLVMADSPGRVSRETLEDIAYEAELMRGLDRGFEATSLTALANVKLARGDADGARTLLDQAIKVDEKSSLAWAALGALHASRPEGRADARAAFERAAQLDPEAAAPLVGLGRLDLGERNFSRAIERFQAALKLGEDFPARLALGDALREADQYAEAMVHLERAVELDPRSADAWSSYGRALLAVGHAEEAERALRSALSLRRDVPTVLAMGLALGQLKRPAEALELFDELLRANGTDASALYGAAMVSEGLLKSNDALVYYRRLLALRADGPAGSLIRRLQGEARERIAFIEKSAAPPAQEAETSPTKRQPK